jgi:hypothetical protein
VLQSGAIAGAALDVFQKEPLDPSSPLWDCDNLLVTAHNADYTEDYFDLGACVRAWAWTCVGVGVDVRGRGGGGLFGCGCSCFR